MYPYIIDTTINEPLDVTDGQTYDMMPAKIVHGTMVLMAPVPEL